MNIHIRIKVPRSKYEKLFKNTDSFGIEITSSYPCGTFSSTILDSIKDCNFSGHATIVVYEFLKEFEKLNILFENCEFAPDTEVKLCFWLNVEKGNVEINDLQICAKLCDGLSIQNVHNVLREFGWKYSIVVSGSDDHYDENDEENEIVYYWCAIAILDGKIIKCLSDTDTIDPRKFKTIKIKRVPEFFLSTSA